MRKYIGLFVGGIVAFFTLLFLVGILSASSGRNIFMDGAAGWPWLVALPIAVSIGYIVGQKISAPNIK